MHTLFKQFQNDERADTVECPRSFKFSSVRIFKKRSHLISERMLHSIQTVQRRRRPHETVRVQNYCKKRCSLYILRKGFSRHHRRRTCDDVKKKKSLSRTEIFNTHSVHRQRSLHRRAGHWGGRGWPLPIAADGPLGSLPRPAFMEYTVFFFR